jgi:ABC-2 type transport system ATP-binding protein
VARLRPGDDHDIVSAALNRDLIEAGVSVFAIAPRARSLEGIYRAASAIASHRQETV